MTFAGESGEAQGVRALRVFPAGDGLCLGVRVSPSAPRTELKGVHGERLKVAVSAPPEDNRANRELESAFAKFLGLSRECVKVVRGHTSRDKVVAFMGLGEARLRDLLEAALEERLAKGDEGLVG